MNRFFPEIKKNFGFGMMRLPMVGDKVDLEQTQKMVDYFLGNGFNYFDTAPPTFRDSQNSPLRSA